MLSASVSAGMENHSAAASAASAMASARLCDKTDLANPASGASSSDGKSGRAALGAGMSVPGPSVMSLSSSTSPFITGSASVTQLPPPEFADFPFEPPGATSAIMSNGRPSTIIPMSTTSFRPVTTLPRRTTGASACNNEMSSPSSHQHQHGSLNRKPHKVAASTTAGPGTSGNHQDELRV